MCWFAHSPSPCCFIVMSPVQIQICPNTNSLTAFWHRWSTANPTCTPCLKCLQKQVTFWHETNPFLPWHCMLYHRFQVAAAANAGLGPSSGDGAREVPPLGRDTCLWQRQGLSWDAHGGRISPCSVIIFLSGTGDQV